MQCTTSSEMILYIACLRKLLSLRPTEALEVRYQAIYELDIKAMAE